MTYQEGDSIKADDQVIIGSHLIDSEASRNKLLRNTESNTSMQGSKYKEEFASFQEHQSRKSTEV